MFMVLLIVSLPCAALAAYMVFDFLSWQAAGHITTATITGFQDRKNKGLRLPVVSYEREDGSTHTAETERIDQLLFLMNRPGRDDFTTIIVREGNPPRARIYGAINLIAAVLLCLPLLAALGLYSGKALIIGQITYIAIFVLMVVGGWILLKLIQRS